MPVRAASPSGAISPTASTSEGRIGSWLRKLSYWAGFSMYAAWPTAVPRSSNMPTAQNSSLWW